MIYEVIDKIHSTNSYIKENIDNLPDYYVLRAVEQTNGRGQFDRVWICEKGKDLAMSILISADEKVLPYLEDLTQILGVTLATLLSRIAPSIESQIKIKLPNDILIKSKVCQLRKICGILTEAITLGDKTRVIIGIGLNVNSQSKHKESGECRPTSLFDETKTFFDLDILCKKIAQNIFDNIENGLGKIAININS